MHYTGLCVTMAAEWCLSASSLAGLPYIALRTTASSLPAIARCLPMHSYIVVIWSIWPAAHWTKHRVHVACMEGQGCLAVLFYFILGIFQALPTFFLRCSPGRTAASWDETPKLSHWTWSLFRPWARAMSMSLPSHPVCPVTVGVRGTCYSYIHH